MTQLSLFSADMTPPRPADLGGLLAAHGQITVGPAGARLSIVVAERWRARALLRELKVRDVSGEAVPVAAAEGQAAGLPETVERAWLVRSDRLPDLATLAAAWTRGAVKAVPRELTIRAGLLRCWVVAAGRPDDVGFLLGVDTRAPDTYEGLAAALARAGLAGVAVGVRAGGPAIRVVGHKRLVRLVELVGSAPPEAPPGAFPDGDRTAPAQRA